MKKRRSKLKRKITLDWSKAWDMLSSSKYFQELRDDRFEKCTIDQIHADNKRLGFEMNKRFLFSYGRQLEQLSEKGLQPYKTNELVRELYEAFQLSTQRVSELDGRRYDSILKQLKKALEQFETILRDYDEIHHFHWINKKTGLMLKDRINPDTACRQLFKAVNFMIEQRQADQAKKPLKVKPNLGCLKPGPKKTEFINDAVLWLVLYLHCKGGYNIKDAAKIIQKLVSCFDNDNAFRSAFDFKQTAERQARLYLRRF